MNPIKGWFWLKQTKPLLLPSSNHNLVPRPHSAPGPEWEQVQSRQAGYKAGMGGGRRSRQPSFHEEVSFGKQFSRIKHCPLQRWPGVGLSGTSSPQPHLLTGTSTGPDAQHSYRDTALLLQVASPWDFSLNIYMQGIVSNFKFMQIKKKKTKKEF